MTNSVRSRTANALVFVCAILGGLVAGTAFIASRPETNSWGGWLTSIGIISGLVGTYLCLILIVMVARVPLVEREIGHDRLIAYHRRLAPLAVGLILLHVIALVIGYAETSGASWWAQLKDFVLSYPWMMPATLSVGLFIVLSLSSIRIVRRIFRYETWWVAHTYFYLAIALAIGHQLVSGSFFPQHNILRYFWISLYVITMMIVLISRVAIPIKRSLQHDLRIESFVAESPGVVSVYLKGKDLDYLNAQGGHFFQWRFLTRHWWWQAHPYSLSASPKNNRLRITVKGLGDHSSDLKYLNPGTRVAIEGPYGTFTKPVEKDDEIVCVAAGVGIAPVRALLEELPKSSRVSLLYRVSKVSNDNIILRKELETLFSQRPHWNMWYITGKRRNYSFMRDRITKAIPNLSTSQVYICGPEQFGQDIETACREAGTPKKSIHREMFVF